MKRLVKREVWASEIADFLGVGLEVRDFIVRKPCSSDHYEENSLVYMNMEQLYAFNCNIENILIITSSEVTINNPFYIKIEKPELQFFRVVNEFFMDEVPVNKPTNAVIAADAQIGRNTIIGENSFIGNGVIIGAYSVIGRNVYIADNTIIGKRCHIKDNAVIGSEGYQFIETEKGYISKPCVGRIIIQNNVLIGSSSIIEKPVFDTTEIQNDAKIDDLVNIGSTCLVGEKVLIAAGSILCHGVRIGKATYIGAGVRIRDKVIIGSNTIVGIGSVVISNLEDGKTYVGNPASSL